MAADKAMPNSTHTYKDVGEKHKVARRRVK